MKQSHRSILWLTVFVATCVFAASVFLSRRESIEVVSPQGDDISNHRKAMVEALTKNEKLLTEALQHQAENYFPWKKITTLGVQEVHVLEPKKKAAVNPQIRWTDEIGNQQIVIPREKESTLGEFYLTPNGSTTFLVSRKDGLYVIVLDISALNPTLHQLMNDAMSKIPMPVGVEGVTVLDGTDDKAKHFHERWNMPSHLGDWSVAYRHASLNHRYHHTPTLVGGAALALLLLMAGAYSAWHYRNMQIKVAHQTSFVNRASHELRIPLTNLLLHADLAKESLEQGETQQTLEYMRNIHEESQRLSRITDNILIHARKTHGKPALPETSPADPVIVAQETFKTLASLWDRKGITHEFISPASMLPHPAADALRQILTNLCSNIEKYAVAGNHASVTISTQDGKLLATVADNGPDIPDAMWEKIFLPFERADNSLVHAVSGTGLGLSISRDLAIQCGGSLTFMQENGIKSFQLSLPYSS